MLDAIKGESAYDGTELERFEHSLRRVVNVLLLHVADDAVEAAVGLTAVDEDVARDLAAGLTTSEHVHQRRLAGAR
jgi:hypothetical protein